MRFLFQITMSTAKQIIMPTAKAYFRKVGDACSLTKKGHILINLGQFKDETPLNRMQI